MLKSCEPHWAPVLDHWEESLESFNQNHPYKTNPITYFIYEGNLLFHTVLNFPQGAKTPLKNSFTEDNVPRRAVAIFALTREEGNWVVHYDYRVAGISSLDGEDLEILAAYADFNFMLERTIKLQRESNILYCASGTCALKPNNCIAGVFNSVFTALYHLVALEVKANYRDTYEKHGTHVGYSDVFAWGNFSLILKDECAYSLSGKTQKKYEHICHLNKEGVFTEDINEHNSHALVHVDSNNVQATSAVTGWGLQATAANSGFHYPLGNYIRKMSEPDANMYIGKEVPDENSNSSHFNN